MSKLRFQMGVMGLSLAIIIASLLPLTLGAQAQPVPQMGITRFKVTTSGQFVEIYNTGQSVDMSRVQLAYYNHYDLTKATSSKLVSLSGQLDNNGFYIVNDSAMALCYQAVVASASLGFSTTAGMVQLLYLDQTEVGGMFTTRVLDSIAWSRTAVPSSSVHTLPANPLGFLQKTGSNWTALQPSAANPCQYESQAADSQTVELDERYVFLGSTLPPVRRVAATSTSNGKVNRNVGKMAPVINEALPNPASPQTDADDEFIELYNPNETDFDLTDFKLAFGSTNPKKYTFPEGTVLKPKQFRAFTSGDTSISLSNTEAQVWLLDPNEQVIGQSDPYSKAKDGQSWALDGGKWIWSSLPTPNEMNAISPVASDASKAKSTAAVLGINNSNNSSSNPTGGASGQGQPQAAGPINPSILAIVGMGALGYAIYEYRSDISNKLFQFRRYFRNRQTIR